MVCGVLKLNRIIVRLCIHSGLYFSAYPFGIAVVVCNLDFTALVMKNPVFIKRRREECDECFVYS